MSGSAVVLDLSPSRHTSPDKEGSCLHATRTWWPRVWDAATIESLATKVERCGHTSRELGSRCEASAARALGLADALRAAGRALAFVDEDHDGACLVIERLTQLEREADGLLTLWQDDVTRQYSETLRWQARLPLDDEATLIRPRIIPPARTFARRST